MKNIRDIIICLAVALVCFFLVRTCGRPTERITYDRIIDTVIMRDTIRDTLRMPVKVYYARRDTVFLPVVRSNENCRPAGGLLADRDEVSADGKNGQDIAVVVPIQRKEYRTDDYYAVIEGYKPELIIMETYPEIMQISTIDKITVKKRPRFALGIQAGYGYSNQKLHPYIGIGVQYNLWSF